MEDLYNTAERNRETASPTSPEEVASGVTDQEPFVDTAPAVATEESESTTLTAEESEATVLTDAEPPADELPAGPDQARASQEPTGAPYVEERPQARDASGGATNWAEALPWLQDHAGVWYRIGYYQSAGAALASAGQGIDDQRVDPAAFRFSCGEARGGGAYLYGIYEEAQ
jgi:hypothetical protein